MRSYLHLSLLVAFAATANAADPAAEFDQANRDFSAGDFAKAEAAYRSLTEGALVSPELFFNIGNATYRQDRPGEAALWYRRALAFDPRFAEARQNLRVVQKRTGYHEFSLQGADAFLARFRTGELLAIFTTGAWLAALAIASALLVPRMRDFRPLLYSATAIAALLAGAAAWGLNRQRDHLNPDGLAIVIGNEAAAVTVPVPDSAKVVDLPPGSELHIIQRAGPWTYVGIPQDLRGWVRSELIAPVLETKS